MPKLKPDTQRARREHILDAAEQSFARSGFHRTTMQDICREASVSPGALYVYFSSKEDLIAGIVERDRAKLSDQLKELAAAPDLMAALERLGEHYAVEEPHYKRVLSIEIGSESTRNPAVGEIFRSVDSFCLDSFMQLFNRAREEGKIAPELGTNALAQIVAVIGDGLFWRSAVDPAFDAKSLIPVIAGLVRTLINPVDPNSGAQTAQSQEAAE
jgi:TetR/AcrR family transcriptional repressor of uid operon